MKSLLVLALFVVASYAAAVNLNSPAFPTLVVGVQSNWIKIQATSAPQGSGTLTITSDGATISPSTLYYDATLPGAVFRVTPTVTGFITFNFTMDNSTYVIAPPQIHSWVNQRPISLVEFPSTANVKQSVNCQLYTQFAPSNDLSITLTSYNDTLVFTPNPVVLAAGKNTVAFSYVSFVQATGVWAHFNITSGDAAAQYSVPSDITNMAIYSRGEVVFSDFPSDLIPGVPRTMQAYISGSPVNNTFSVNLKATNMVFSPSNVTFTPNNNVATFTVESDVIVSNEDATFFAQFTDSAQGWTDYDTISTPATFSVAKRTVDITWPSAPMINTPTTVSVQIGSPVRAGAPVAVTFQAPTTKFFPSTIVFDGAVTSITVQMTVTQLAQEYAVVYVNSTDAAYWTPSVTSKQINPIGGVIFSVDYTYTNSPNLWVGATSQSYTLQASIPPTKSVTVTPVCNNIVFNPPVLTFTPGQLVQSFTMTPTALNLDPVNTAAVSTEVDFVLGGPDQAMFGAVDSIYPNIQFRTIQAVFSPHIGSVTPAGLYAGKDYIVWVSVSQAPETSLTVTPVGPQLTFSPSTLTFSSSTTRIAVTVSAGQPTDDEYYIDFMIGGVDGGKYRAANRVQYEIDLRSLSIYDATFAPDNRMAGDYVTVVSGADVGYFISTYHTYSFSLYTATSPNSKLTVTPRCPNVDVSPSSVSLGSVYTNIVNIYSPVNYGGVTYNFTKPVEVTVFNFTITSVVNGVHNIVFDLSGDDANLYTQPSDITVRVSAVQRPSNDAGKFYLLSSAPAVSTVSYVLLSVVVLVMGLLF